MRNARKALGLGIVVGLLAGSCGDSGNDTATPTTPLPPPPVTERFTLDAEDGFISYSSPLATLSDDESFEIEFRPLAINDGDSGFANVIEFWLDRGPPEDGIAMGLDWFPDSEWGVGYYTPAERFVNFPVFRLINVNGAFRTVRIRRANGVTEWLLDGESLVVLDDMKASRTVYTRVVGTRAEFRYQRAATSRTVSQRGGRGEEACGDCRLREASLEP